MSHGVKRIVQGITNLWCAPSDARAYALVRMAFSLTVLLNLYELWPHRFELLSSDGYVYWSPFSLSPSAVTPWLLAFACAACCLFVGFLTPIAAVALAFGCTNFTRSGSPMLDGADSVLRVSSLLIAISPVGRTWSVDRRIKKWLRLPDSGPPMIYGLRLMQWQIAMIYWGTVWLKVPDYYWRHGLVVSYFMTSMFSTYPSSWWAHLETLSALLTFGALLTEITLPLLLWSSRYRGLGFFLGAGLHVSIALVSPLYVFSFSMLTLYGAFLTQENFSFLERLGATVSRRVTGRSTTARGSATG